jgi:hypothetical protein
LIIVMIRRACRAIALTAALLLALPSGSTSQTLDTDDVKAGFLFNFAKFVEWPADAMNAASPITIGVLGNDGVNDALRTIVKDKHIGGRAIAVRRTASIDDMAGLHVLFVGQGEKARITDVLKRLDGMAILTVSDVDRFCEQGGAIGLVREGNHVRFEVNLDAAERARLKVSSKLLTLARRVQSAKAGDR